MTDFVPPLDDHVVRLLREAGTISLGKTATPEFGLPCYTETDIGPPARTPWDTTRLAGGSSGGAGAAVASGFVPFAQGSDGGGSIRIPASVCGLVGLKTSRGRVSKGPLDIDATRLCVLGPLARTVRDAAAFLDAVAVPQPGDPDPLPPLPPGESFLGWCDRDPGRLRIGRFIDSPMESEPDPQVRDAWERSCCAARRARARRRRRRHPAAGRGGAGIRDGVVGGRRGDSGRARGRGAAAPADPAPARTRRALRADRSSPPRSAH